MVKNRERRNSKEIKATAFHEAGHAVVAIVVGIPIGRIWVRAYKCKGPGSFWHPSPDFITFRSDHEKRSNARKCIIVTYSGVPAQRLCDRAAPAEDGSSDDEYARKTQLDYQVFPKIFDFPGDHFCDVYLERLRAEAKRLVNRYESAISHLAKTLCKLPNLKMEPSEIKQSLSGFNLGN